ncbi:MAG TPA: hypothetical protein VF461_21380 [Gemmatimonadaceae bacterium]
MTKEEVLVLSNRLPNRILKGALGAFLSLAFMACGENLTGSLGCPQLCQDQSALLRDTTLTGVLVVDTVVNGFPLQSTARDFTLLSRGDSGDIRVVFRFDTLPNTFRHPNATVDSAVTRVDKAMVQFAVDTSYGKLSAPITIDAYDVDTTAADTLPLALVPLFRPDRLIGSATFASTALSDTLAIPLDSAVVRTKAQAGAHLRVGLRIRGTSADRLRIAGSVYTPLLTFRVSPDTLVHTDSVPVISKTPATDGTLASLYAAYSIIVAGAEPLPPRGVIAVGGIAGARTFLRFNVPPLLIDSVQVVRASLLLQQLPSRVQASSADTIAILANPVLAGAQVTDLNVLLQLTGNGTLVGVDSVRMVPKDAGLKSVELVSLFRVWRGIGEANSIRAIVLRAKQEASSPGELNFVSNEGPVDQRPRLQITYVPRRGFGLP